MDLRFVDLRDDDLRVVLLRELLLRELVLRELVLREAGLLRFFAPPFFELPRFDGTLAPFLRASDRPIAMACLRLFTFLPERPLFSVPFLRSLIARFTFWPAFFPYLAIH
ncbi:MAG TPA: hypothetical protein VFJ62_08555, partial [Usitatibacter sp.]|nr:hypothetical protein [Usitatibacter sp.]